MLNHYPYKLGARVHGMINDNTQVVVQRGQDFWPFACTGEAIRYAAEILGIEIQEERNALGVVFHLNELKIYGTKDHEEIIPRLGESGQALKGVTFWTVEKAVSEIALRTKGYLQADRELPEVEREDRHAWAVLAAWNVKLERSRGIRRAYEVGKITLEQFEERMRPILADEQRAQEAADRRWR